MLQAELMALGPRHRKSFENLRYPHLCPRVKTRQSWLTEPPCNALQQHYRRLRSQNSLDLQPTDSAQKTLEQAGLTHHKLPPLHADDIYLLRPQQPVHIF